MTTDLVTTPYGASSTADDVLADHDLTGRTAVVTGASSGLGAETARALAHRGALVVLAVRDVAAGGAVADRIRAGAPRSGAVAVPRPVVRPLDLTDPASVRAFVDGWEGALDLLVANAGVVTSGLRRTSVGLEWQLATNHLGHFRLVTGLHRALADAAAGRGEARVTVLSSTAHMRGGVDFDDLQFERREYDPQIAYAQSKTANSLFTVEATRRWAGDGVVANAVNPGGIRTGLQRDFSPAQRASLDAAEAAGVFRWKSVAQGAATTMVAAVAPELRGLGGRYLDDCREAYPVPDDALMADHPHGVKHWAQDPALAARLWTVSEELCR